MTPRIVLLDIDGTLIHCGGAGRRAMELATKKHTGRIDVLDFRFGGLTDRLIARRALVGAAQEASESAIDALLASYLEFLPGALDSGTDYEILPGVPEFVSQLRSVAALALGLGTGNLERGAEAKLAHGGLWEHFVFGGFGSDHELRDEILRIGAARGAQQLGAATAVPVFVVGDTPHDVSAARSIGACSIAIATGGFTAAELRAAGADEVVEDLRDARAIERLLG